MNNPLVSVIIVTWNRKDDMLETLDALQNQTYSNFNCGAKVKEKTFLLFVKPSLMHYR